MMKAPRIMLEPPRIMLKEPRIMLKASPLRSKRVRSQKTPWLTDTIKFDMNRRDYLKKKAVKNNSLWYHNAYKALYVIR
jgi:hypothetical protein